MTTSYPHHLVQNLLDAANHLTLSFWRFDSAEEYCVADEDMEVLCAAVAPMNEAVMINLEQETTRPHHERLLAAAPTLYDLVQALTEPFPESINFWDWFDDVQAYAKRLVDDIAGEESPKVIDRAQEAD